MIWFYILQKGDLLLSVDGTNLCGLTHSQAVATLKATINLDQVALGIMDGPETSFGASNFVPSWMYWQKLPRSLQYPKTGMYIVLQIQLARKFKKCPGQKNS